MSTQQNTRGMRGNGNFRIATSELKMTEKQLPSGPSSSSSSSSGCDFCGKARFSTSIRPILYHTRCNNDERDNNISDDDGSDDDDDVVFYKRFEQDQGEVDADDENNREFDSPKDSSGSSARLSSGTEGLWTSPFLGCALPRLISGQRSLHHSLRSFNDMQLESIGCPLEAQNQQLDWEETPEDGLQELSVDTAAEQPQQEGDEVTVRDDRDKSDSSSSETRDSNQFSYEPIETTMHSAKCYEGESPLLRRKRRSSSICCEPMVRYELFDSVRKSQQQLVAKSSESNFFSFARNRDHEDDDVMNIRSPVNQRPPSRGSISTRGEPQQQQQQEHLVASRQGWTPRQLRQYNEVLTFLQDVCATRSPHISIPGTRLAQMEQLLRSLHPTA